VVSFLQGDGKSGEVGKIAGDFALPDDPSAEWGDRRQEVTHPTRI
jgi:hypothetical protein